MKFKAFVIKTFYKFLLRPVFFRQDPEKIHNLFTKFGNWLGRYRTTKFLTDWFFNYQHSALQQRYLGINFEKPIGLAAGFDKDANLIEIIESVGFGFTEIGTVTNKPYAGNPKPRLYRLPKSLGVVVNYGLKNLGVGRILLKIRERKNPVFPIAISIGQTNSYKTAKIEDAVEDYYQCLKKINVAGIGDFYEINISCPNLFGGEPFTTPARLTQLLQKLVDLKIKKPLFLKMPINLSWREFKKLLEVAIRCQVKGVVIGNLNKNRLDKTIRDRIPPGIKGSVSGRPCWELSNQLISQAYQHFGRKLIIIGVGGIFSAQDAYEKIKRGASLVELITSMIYEGPQLIGEINRGLVELLKRDGYNNISEAVGTYHKQ